MIARIQQSMDKKEGDKGFTLIELLVVIIIIGILAAIAIPVFLNQRQKAVDTGIKADLRSIANELESAYVDDQEYPSTISGGAAGTATMTVGAATVAKSNDNNAYAYTVDGGTGGSDTYLITGSNATNGTGSTFTYDSGAGGLQD